MRYSRLNTILLVCITATTATMLHFQGCSKSDAQAVSTPTGGPPGSVSSTARYSVTRVFQDGLNGYSGTRDTTLIKDTSLATGIVSGSTAGNFQQTFVRADSTNFGMYALLKFSLDGVVNEYLKTGETCDAAIEVELAQIAYHGSPGLDGTTFNYIYPLNATAQNWDEATATWTESSTGVAWIANPGLPNSPALGSVNLGIFEATEGAPNSGIARNVQFSVERETAKRWLCHPDENQGVLIRNTTASATAASRNPIFSREFPRQDLRPKLILVLSRTGPF